MRPASRCRRSPSRRSSRTASSTRSRAAPRAAACASPPPPRPIGSRYPCGTTGPASPPRRYAQVAASSIDVLFLDIHMPGLSGFQVVERVPPGPAVVFTTAHDEHAVRAFEVNAVDYLLKPVEAARLRQTIDRVKERLEREDYKSEEAERLRAAAAEYESTKPL